MSGFINTGRSIAINRMSVKDAERSEAGIQPEI
jgi:hypothetical protein